MQLNISKRGEIVIPKKIREHLGITHARTVVVDIKDDALELRPAIDVVKLAAERAKRIQLDVSKIKMGNDFYEEEFDKKWAHVSRR